MIQNLIFWPMLIQALVSIWLYIPMSRARFGAVKRGDAKAYDFKLPKQNEPQDIAKFGNAVTNQFELPLLFFVVGLAAHSANLVDWPLLILAWAFALTKTVHSVVHVTVNRLRHRFRLFFLSLAITLLMWIWFAIRLVLA